MGEDTKGRQLPWRKRLMEYVEFASVIVSVLMLVFSFFWFGFRNEVQQEARDFLGVLTIDGKVDRNADQIKNLIDTVTRLLPEVHVAEYDHLRTRIFSPCFPGTPCEYQIRARRTPDGVGCSAPTVDARVIVDRFGLEHSADVAVSRRPNQLNTEWRSLSGAFYVPSTVEAGVAEFFMVLIYDCDGEEVTNRTPRMVFEVGRPTELQP